jgi:Domain of unknown function (DUF1906)
VGLVAAKVQPVKCQGWRVRRARARLLLAALAALALGAGWQGAAAPGATAKTIHFAGRAIDAPSSWPVFRLSQHPGMCVRLDRRAVYLGTPSPNQRCPAEAIGQRQAILVEPAAARAARSSALPTAPRRIARAGGGIFTGLGFDACSTPSTRTMAAWGLSPYRAIGIYIGGANRACSQPNLTSSWVAAQTAADWHLIPTYVGLQAPTSSCSSCAKLSTSQASAQGTAAAIDAVAQAAAVAIGPGSPIYFDMESYTRTSSATAATLAFLEAWTSKLHSLGYVSGVYSSSASGIADLARAYGTGYLSPDHLWIANWNGQKNTLDPVVPASAWAAHQRIHQYYGGHNETWGGVTINIDNDYVDGATVGTAVATGNDPVGFLDLAGSPSPGQVRVKGWAFDPDAPTLPLAIRLVVGGKAGEPEVATYELGAASRWRSPVGARYPEAGAQHGFDVTLPTLKSGKQRICVYALNFSLGADTQLGCRGRTIPVAISVSKLKANGKRLRARVICKWPAGTECPGQIVVRTRFRAPVARYSGSGPRTRRVSRVLGRTAFALMGTQAQTFDVPFTAGGKELLRARGSLKAQVVVAIPGGRRIRVLEIEQP